MKRVILAGYYGKENAGDDAFLAVTAWGVQKYLGADDLWALAPKIPVLHGPRVRPLVLPKKATPFLQRLKLRFFLRRVQSVVFGGGSNFHTTRWLKEDIQLLRSVGRGPHFAIGVSIGPFRDETAEETCRELFSLLDYVGVRDEASLLRARALAPRSTKVELTFDIAPLLPMAAGVEPPALAAALRPRTLAVALCNDERFVKGDLETEARRVEVVAGAIRESLEKGVCDRVLLVDMNSHPKFGDLEVHARLKTLIGDAHSVVHVPYQGDPAEPLRLIGSARAVVAMRLHAAVYGFCAGTRVGMIAYHEKCHEWAGRAGIPAEWVGKSAALEPGWLAGLIGRLMDEEPSPGLSREEGVATAMKNWEWLKEA